LRDDVTLTALRLQGFGPSVAARCAILEALLGQFGTVRTADAAEAEALWRDAQTLVPLNDGRPLWRISIPAKACCMIVATLQPFGARWLADWAGGLLWMTFDGDPAMVRQVAADAGGHATLVRGGPALRAAIPTFQPQSPALAALETRVRRAFDPSGVFETRRFGEPADAD
jgi:glycolate oxidase FAD binding subunit